MGSLGVLGWQVWGQESPFLSPLVSTFCAGWVIRVAQLSGPFGSACRVRRALHVLHCHTLYVFFSLSISLSRSLKRILEAQIASDFKSNPLAISNRGDSKIWGRFWLPWRSAISRRNVSTISNCCNYDLRLGHLRREWVSEAAAADPGWRGSEEGKQGCKKTDQVDENSTKYLILLVPNIAGTKVLAALRRIQKPLLSTPVLPLCQGEELAGNTRDGIVNLKAMVGTDSQSHCESTWVHHRCVLPCIAKLVEHGAADPSKCPRVEEASACRERARHINIHTC